MFNEKNKPNDLKFKLKQRLENFQNNNYIDYITGPDNKPMEIRLNVEEGYISIKANAGPGQLFDEIINLVITEWNVRNFDINTYGYIITFPYDIEILNNYLLTYIVYE